MGFLLLNGVALDRRFVLPVLVLVLDWRIVLPVLVQVLVRGCWVLARLLCRCWCWCWIGGFWGRAGADAPISNARKELRAGERK